MTATTTATAHVPGVRDIPRLCTCRWLPVYEMRRPAGWDRMFTEPGCPVHGTRERPSGLDGERETENWLRQGAA